MADKDIIKVTVSVERIRFYKNEWGIIECSINKIKQGAPKLDKNGIAIFKGVMPQLKENNLYNITAEYTEDPKFGGQYNILSIFTALDFGTGDAEGQKKFLSSIFTPLQVTNMYEALDNPFQALKDKDTVSLIKIKGCGMDTADRWIRKFEKHIGEAQIYTELEEYNLTTNMIKRLMDRYNSPELVIEKVKNNPYVLCNEVKGIGWKTADKIALEGGIGEYSTKRIGAYMIHYLDESGENGCSWITPDELMGAILEGIGEEVPDANITEAIHELGDELWWNEDKTKIGLRRYFNIEQKIAEELIRIRDAESKITYSNFEDTVKHMEHRQGWEYTDEQLEGAKVGLDNNLVVITGSGGTGKTSMVGLILETLRNYSYAQCSLSGRAASRMSEVTGQEGYTIHRLLNYPLGDKQGFTYHDENQLGYDIYIVDEISMIDAYLFYYLLRAIPSGAKLFMLGDPGQLESIGSGNIAHDMINSSEIATVQLTKIHRQAAKSAIITESIKIRNGQQLVNKDWAGKETRGELQDLTIDCYSDKSNTYYKIMEAFTRAMAEKDFNIMETQVIVPIKNVGSSCTYEINNAIQELYNPEDKKLKEVNGFSNGKPYVLRVGDKVMNMVNTYKTSPPIYNGNLGIIEDIYYDEDLDEELMLINFKGIGEVKVPKDCWNNIELGYACTCHKSQGSEFNYIIFGVDFTSYSLLSREMIYTGITRAKKKCDLIAQTGALRMAISKEGVSKKQTHLQQCLYDVAHPKLIF